MLSCIPHCHINWDSISCLSKTVIDLFINIKAPIALFEIPLIPSLVLPIRALA